MSAQGCAGQRRARWGVRFLLAALAGCALAAAPAAAAAAAASPQVVRVGATPALPQGAQVIGAVPASKQLQLTVALESQDPSGLESLATSISTPGSPLYHQYLTVAQFAQSFGATPAQIATVQSALRAQGVSVGNPMANDLTLPVTGSAAQVEKAFSVSLSQVELPSGRTAYANAQAPSIPANAAQYVQGVIGLDNVALDEPQQATTSPLQAFHPPESLSTPAGESNSSIGKVATGGPQPCETVEEKKEEVIRLDVDNGRTTVDDAFFGYSADEISAVYKFPGLYQAGDLGAGQTIAVFEQENFLASDIAEYQKCYGTSTAVSTVNVDKGPGAFKTGEGGEAGLDIEQIIGLAPAANVLVYQGPPTAGAPAEIISAIVSENKAKVISSSWGECEAETAKSDPALMAAENTLLQEAATQGQSFFVSSGDSGSEQCTQVNTANTSLSVLNPASQPFATGVGGTDLVPTSPAGEGVWNDGVIGGKLSGSGGGISAEFAMPSYQSGASASLGVVKSESSATPCHASSDCREVPDVSAEADPDTAYVVFTDGKWGVIGGTSAAAPLWAAFTALTDASSACRGVPVGFANPALYSIAGSNYSGNFHDITHANFATGFANNNPLHPLEANALYPVGPGYDMATGLGSPIGATLAASLCSLVAPQPPAPPVQPGPPIVSPTPSSTGSAASAGTSSSDTTATISSAQIAALLGGQLTPSGKTAKIAALLKAGAFAFAYKALEAGSATIDWYQLPSGAKLAKNNNSSKKKPVLVAAGELHVHCRRHRDAEDQAQRHRQAPAQPCHATEAERNEHLHTGRRRPSARDRNEDLPPQALGPGRSAIGPSARS